MIMDKQPELGEWKSRRDAGIKLANDNAGDNWSRYALSFLRHFIVQNKLFIAEDLWTAGLQEPPSGGKRALGAVMQEAVNRGWMEAKTDFNGELCARPAKSSNGGLKQLWVSLTYNNQLRIVPPAYKE